jgi:putative transposase
MYQYRNLTPEEREELVRERVARGFPAHQPPHPVRGRDVYLVTAACYGHAHHLPLSERRWALLESLFKQLSLMTIEIHAWAILTNHYHLLLGIEEFGALGDVLRRVHGRTSRAWNVEDGREGRKVWYRYTDRAMRSERHYYTTVNYIHYNPVKRRLAESPYDWPWSSVHWYLDHIGRGWLRDVWQQYPVLEYSKGWDDI